MKYIFHWIAILCIFVLVLVLIQPDNKENFENVNESPPFPIDVVYTWAGENDSNDIRISYNNELKYSMMSVLKFLPWVNRIHVLMNPPKKVPDWLTNEMRSKVTFVDQTQTFPSQYELPNTAASAIETTLHNIPNLSEHFIFFNDDFFVGKALPYTYFFTSDGKAFVSDLTAKSKSMVLPGKTSKLKIALPDMGATGFYPHVPISLLKSEITKYQEKYPDYIHWIRSIRSRKGLGCNVCEENNLGCPCHQQQFIIAKHMYDNNKAVLKKYEIGSSCSKKGYINSFCLDYLDDIKNNPPPTFCIQDTTENPEKKKIFKQKLNAFFQAFYGS